MVIRLGRARGPKSRCGVRAGATGPERPPDSSGRSTIVVVAPGGQDRNRRWTWAVAYSTSNSSAIRCWSRRAVHSSASSGGSATQDATAARCSASGLRDVLALVRGLETSGPISGGAVAILTSIPTWPPFDSGSSCHGEMVVGAILVASSPYPSDDSGSSRSCIDLAVQDTGISGLILWDVLLPLSVNGDEGNRYAVFRQNGYRPPPRSRTSPRYRDAGTRGPARSRRSSDTRREPRRRCRFRAPGYCLRVSCSQWSDAAVDERLAGDAGRLDSIASAKAATAPSAVSRLRYAR